jgi:carbonic anhydrase/acetyltransferase-like protein (isoleucine patch superfamily)
MHCAVAAAESGPVEIGANCVIMENAVLRGTPQHPLIMGDHVLAGPHSRLTGCGIADEVFIANGARVFTGAQMGRGSSVALGGTVHIGCVVPPLARIPIGQMQAALQRYTTAIPAVTTKARSSLPQKAADVRRRQPRRLASPRQRDRLPAARLRSTSAHRGGTAEVAAGHGISARTRHAPCGQHAHRTGRSCDMRSHALSEYVEGGQRMLMT